MSGLDFCIPHTSKAQPSPKLTACEAKKSRRQARCKGERRGQSSAADSRSGNNPGGRSASAVTWRGVTSPRFRSPSAPHPAPKGSLSARTPDSRGEALPGPGGGESSLTGLAGGTLPLGQAEGAAKPSAKPSLSAWEPRRPLGRQVQGRGPGPLRALLLTEPLRPALSAPGAELSLRSEQQHRAALRWADRRTEALLEHLRSNSVGLLLSTVRQGEAVIYYAKLHGVSVVEGVLSEEMALISEITGVSPYAPSGDNMYGEITEAAVATFCQPLLLGSKRCAHIGFSSVCAFQPHCLILCGPVDGVNEQHAAALQEAFTMLQQLFETVGHGDECEGEGESQNQASDACSWHSSPAQKQLVPENISCSSQVSACQLEAFSDETETKVLDSDKSESLVDGQKSYSTAVLAACNTDTVTACEVLDVGKGLEKPCCNMVPFKQKGSCVGTAQDHSHSLIEAGSVLPVGGYFEILLHYYIQYYAKQCQQSEVAVVSNVVADALLSIPRALYETAERDSFTKFYLKVINSLQKNQPLPENEEGLESVYCKYQLVVSVLHCVTELLSIDLIIGIKRPLQKIEDHDSEDDI